MKDQNQDVTTRNSESLKYWRFTKIQIEEGFMEV